LKKLQLSFIYIILFSNENTFYPYSFVKDQPTLIMRIKKPLLTSGVVTKKKTL